MNFVRYADLARLIGAIPKIPEVCRVYGVPRSGMIPATMLAIQWNVPVGMVGSTHAAGGHRLGDIEDGGQVLLVDDSLLTGRSMREAVARMIEDGIPEESIRTMAIFVLPGMEGATDYHVMPLGPPRVFEWNLWNNDLARNIMFDLDGVMCFDPEPFDDDGDEYAEAIRTATPRFLPRRPIHSIVTNRIERWRETTEGWLEQHGVRYGSLVMQPFDTAAERRAASDPAEYKAEHYGQSDAWLFVESHDRLGRDIAQRSSRPVFTIQSGLIFKGAA